MYSGKKVYGRPSNIVTRSMSTAITGQEARKRRKKKKAKKLHKQHVANENKKDPTWTPEMELDVLQAGFKKLILIEKKKSN